MRRSTAGRTSVLHPDLLGAAHTTDEPAGGPWIGRRLRLFGCGLSICGLSVSATRQETCVSCPETSRDPRGGTPAPADAIFIVSETDCQLPPRRRESAPKVDAEHGAQTICLYGGYIHRRARWRYAPPHHQPGRGEQRAHKLHYPPLLKTCAVPLSSSHRPLRRPPCAGSSRGSAVPFPAGLPGPSAARGAGPSRRFAIPVQQELKCRSQEQHSPAAAP